MKKSRLRAVIDVGSHAIRMYIGEVVRKGVVRKIEYLWVPIAIGNDTFSRGMVSNSTITEVVRILKNFREVLQSYQIESYKAIATSSLRDASNSETMVERIYVATGIFVEIIEPIEEALIIYQGLADLLKDRYGFLKRNLMVFSMGGGNTQITFQSKGRVLFTDTKNEGTLRLARGFSLSDASLQVMLQLIAGKFLEATHNFHHVGSIDKLVAINDDTFHLIKQLYAKREVKGTIRLSGKTFLPLYKKIEAMSLDEMRHEYKLNDNVLPTTRIAVLIIGMLFEQSGASEVIFPQITLCASLVELLSSVDADAFFPPLSMAFHDNILSAAEAMGRKYCYNADHAAGTRKLALRLFDALARDYGFTEQERIYLEVASLLHDIGSFVSAKSHHKHSAALIGASEILGLNRTDMGTIAQIARYHRRAVPKSSHQDFVQLPRTRRLSVLRMAALLRVADALMGVPQLQLEDMNVALEKERCEIRIKLKNKRYEHLDIFEHLFQRKGDLFESFFGLPIKVERMEG